MRKLRRSTLAGVAVALTLPTAALAANLVGNPSFERPRLPPNDVVFITAPRQFNGGWRVTQGVISIFHFGKAARGKQWLSLNGLAGNDPGAIEQDLATVPGKQYKLRFFLAGEPCGESIKTVRVSWDGMEVATLKFDTTGHSYDDLGWVQESFFVTAADSSSTLRFESLTTGQCGPAIDMVSVR